MKLVTVGLVLLITSVSHAQLTNYKWEILKSLPKQGDRYNDIYFVDEMRGWAIAPYMGIHYPGQMYRTVDGAQTWSAVLDSNLGHLRSIVFRDSVNGWLGMLDAIRWGKDSAALYRTSDGGYSWSAVVFDGPSPEGVCGLFQYDSLHLYGCGRFAGPAQFIRSTDGGVRWRTTDLSTQMGMAIDCYFWSADSGIVSGGSGNGTSTQPSSAVVLLTTDGGATFREIYRTTRTMEWCWKITFPSKTVGYIAIQAMKEGTFCLRTSDGGLTWNDITISNKILGIQGIGFANDSVGWVAGRSTKSGFMTTDAGSSWTLWTEIDGANRFRFINDSLAYVAGNSVSRLRVVSPASVRSTPATDNPFTLVFEEGYLVVQSSRSEPHEAVVTVCDVLGRAIIANRSIGFDRRARIPAQVIRGQRYFVRVTDRGQIYYFSSQ